MDNQVQVMWEVSISGAELDSSRRNLIESIQLDENCDGSDTCTLKINDPEFLFIEDDIFVKDATVSVTYYVLGDTDYYQFDGYISAIDINFPDNGTPTLSIFCLDETHLMNRVERSQTWKDVTRAQVAQEKAQYYGLTFELTPSYAGKVESTITQSGETDIAFLERIVNGEKPKLYMCKVINGTMFYTEKGILSDPVETFRYKKYPWAISSFDPKINKETIPSEVTASDISSDKTEDSTTVSPSDVEAQGKTPLSSSFPVHLQTWYNPENRLWEVYNPDILKE
ncbi:MAG: hypothetical protein EOM67_16605 [Spirochaetia bacterium]|nr:hypothetical protein [Spirochaetia bacterium]